MARPLGRRNEDFESTRAALVERASAALLAPGQTSMSFRQLAEAAGVSPTTLRHYFPGKTELILAVMAMWHQNGLPYMHEAATRPFDGARQSLRWFIDFIVSGWRSGVGAMHATGLAVGLADRELGPGYLTELLEPTLQVAEARLARHVADGQLGPCDVRFAAIELVAPLITALLHQEGLGGKRCRPLDMSAFASEHLERFLRAHAPDAASDLTP